MDFDWDHDTWNIIDNYFEQPEILVRHQLDSFNRFIDYDIPEIIQHHNPIEIGIDWDSKEKKYSKKYSVKFGKIYLSKPLVLERNESIKVLLPNEARLRDLTYLAPLFVDVEHKLETVGEAKGAEVKVESKVPLAKIPIMLHSKYCYLNQTAKNNKTLSELGEGEFDQGGYFIINGSEKVIIGQERPAENKVLCFKNKVSTKYSASAEIKSTRDQRLYPIKIITVNLGKEPSMKDAKSKESGFGRTIKVHFPSLKVDIPLFVVFRAMGVIPDQEIFQMILYNLDNPDPNFVNLLLPSAEEALQVKDPDDKTKVLSIRTEEAALAYMSNAKVLKYDTSFLLKAEDKDAARRKYIRDLMNREFFPHMGENNIKKAYFLGYMTRRLLECFLGIRDYDDRDHYANKRVNLAGPLLAKIFSSNFTRLVRKLKADIQKHLSSDHDVKGVFPGLRKAIQSCSIETSLKYALSTGNWATTKSGNSSTTKGVAQVLQRMSFIQTLSHLRRIQSPLQRAGSKLVPPRKLHETQIGLICPNETPEGAQVGVVKNLAFLTHVTQHSNPARVYMILRELGVRPIEEIFSGELLGATKVFVNGHFFGIIREGLTKKIYDNLRLLKKNSVGLDPYSSIRWSIEYKELIIQTDGGRYCRPVYVVINDPEKNGIPTLLLEKHWDIISKRLKEGTIQWYDLLGSNWREGAANLGTATGSITCNNDNHMTAENSAIIEYLDTDETEGAMIAVNNHILHENRAIDGLSIIEKGSGYAVGDKLVFDNAGTNGLGGAGYVSKINEDGAIQQIRLSDRGRDYLKMPVVTVQSAKGEGAVIMAVAKNLYLNYTHCEIHPMMWFGVVSQSIPFSQHNPSPRNVYQSSMSKQALGIFATNYNSRMDTMAHILCYPQKPLVMNRTMKYTNMDKMPAGMQTIVAIAIWTGYNQEDSVIVNQSSVDRGLMTTLAFKTYKDKEQRHKSVTSVNGMETFGIPDRVLTKDMRGEDKDYMALNPETGVARVGAYVEGGDIIIGKYIELRPEEKETSGKQYKDISKELKHNDDGFIDKVLDGKTGVINYNADGEKIAKVRVNQLRRPEIGDKYACYDAMTEIYTRKGWILISKLSADDEVWTLVEKPSRRGVWQKPIAINSYNYDGMMYKVKSAQVDLLVTPNHRMYVSLDNGKTYGCHEARSIRGLAATYMGRNMKELYLCNTGKSTDSSGNDLYVHYKGKVYCPTVQEGPGVVYVRRNGLAVWSGNSRHAQKGTCGMMYRTEDMPFTDAGIIPDIILNPHALPSRMTVAQLLENLCGKIAALKGEIMDSTPFTAFDLNYVMSILESYGFEKQCDEVMYNGQTGQQLNVPIFIGPTYYQRLKHMVADKIHSREMGPVQLMTRQPQEGRSRDGGLRLILASKCVDNKNHFKNNCSYMAQKPCKSQHMGRHIQTQGSAC